MVDNKLFPSFPVPVILYNFGKESHDLNVTLVKDILKERKSDGDGRIASNMVGGIAPLKLGREI